MKIFGWAADDAGPGFYRLRVPFGALETHTDHHTEVNTRMPDWVLEEADVVVGQRVCQPGATARWRRLADGVYGRRPLLVFELDDDLWDIDPSNGPAWAFYGNNPALLQNLRACAYMADVCTVSTEPLAEIVRKINPNVVVLPNQLPASAFVPGSVTLEPHAGPWRIGWGGGASHARDVEEMAPALRQHFRRNPRDTFVNMGTLFTSVARAVGPRLEEHRWTSNMEEHYNRVSSLDIGLAPLRPSNFNRSKSELKFLEYAAAGAACIASNFTPYANTITDWLTGLLVDTPHEWGRALRQLTQDPAERLVMAAEALAYARTRHIDQHWHEWETVYAAS